MTRARDVATQGGLVLVTKAPFTSATTLNIDNCFSSTYTNYKMIIESTASSSTTGGNVEWRSRNGGTTDTSAAYSWAGIERTASFSSYNALNITYGYIGRGAITSGWGQSVVDILQPYLDEYTVLLSRTAGVQGGEDSYVTTQSMRRTATSHDGISLLFGNATTGTVYIYGYRK